MVVSVLTCARMHAFFLAKISTLALSLILYLSVYLSKKSRLGDVSAGAQQGRLSMSL